MEEMKMENKVPGGAAVNRYKILWRVFVIGNLGLGAYMFAQAGKKERVKKKTEAPVELTSTPTPVTTHTDEEPRVTEPTTTPVIVRQPIPEDQQRELFKWMLEEKRRLKPNNREEKLQIDKESHSQGVSPFKKHPKCLMCGWSFLYTAHASVSVL